MSRKKKITLKQKKKVKKRVHKAHTMKRNTRALLTINNAPIRRKAITKCTHILNTYDTIKQEITQFEEIDKPLFRQWFNSTFGARLTEIRELEQEIDKLEEFVNFVHFVKYGKGISFHQAYNLVVELQKNPEKLKEELEKIREKSRLHDDYDINDDFNIDDDSDINNDFVDDFIDEEDVDSADGGWEEVDEDFTDGFTEEIDEGDTPTDEEIEEFFLHFVSSLPKCDEILDDPRLYAKFFKEFKDFYFSGKKEEETIPLFDGDFDDARLKTLYRSLAMKLHPDNSGIDDAGSIELWYKVQDAYTQKNLEELEKLNALQSFKAGSFSTDCPVSHILAVHADYKEQLKILRMGIQQNKKHVAWNFSKKEDKTEIYANISNDMSETIKEELLRKSYFDTMIKKWAEAPNPGNSQETGRRNRKKFIPPPEQLELPF